MKVKIGIVGIGRAAWGMQCPELEERKDMFEIVASCDALPERNVALKERLGSDINSYSSIHELIKDPGVELVSIATPSREHYDHAEAALKAGKHVCLEKPFCLNYDDAKKLADLEKMVPGKLFIRHNRRFEAGFVHIRKLLDSGILGNIFSIKLNRHKYVRRDDWQSITELGGGQLLNWGPHIVDHGLRLLDSEIVDLWSFCQNTVSPGSAEDHVKILMKGSNNRLVEIEISGGAALKQDVYVIFGTRGAITSNNKTINLKYLDPEYKVEDLKADPNTPPLGFSYHQNSANEEFPWIEKEYKIKDEESSKPSDIWNHIYSCLREDVEFPVQIDQALQVMSIIDTVKKGIEL